MAEYSMLFIVVGCTLPVVIPLYSLLILLSSHYSYLLCEIFCSAMWNIFYFRFSWVKISNISYYKL